MQYLGGTVEEISVTKAGILKPGCDAVLYPSGAAAEDVIAARCRALGVPLHRVDFSSLRLTAASLQRQIFSFGERSMLRLPLLGGFQLRNAAVALTVVDVLRGRGWNIPEPAVRAGLARVCWPGRLEVVRREPLFLMDGGHNPQCVQALAENLRTYLPSRPGLTVLTGRPRGQGLAAHVRPPRPARGGLRHRHADNPRALDAQTLAEGLRAFGKPVTACFSIAEGVPPCEGACGRASARCSAADRCTCSATCSRRWRHNPAARGIRFYQIGKGRDAACASAQ